MFLFLHHMSHMAATAFLSVSASDLAFPFLWLCVLVAALWIESLSAEMVSIWFAPGAFVAMILSFFVHAFWIQLIVFVSLSVILLILAKTVFKKKLTAKEKIVPTNADALIGQIALVEEAIDNQKECGVVKINGQLWTARCERDDDTPQVGDRVCIVCVKGSKLICKSS